MHNSQNTSCNDDEKRIEALVQKIEEEYVRLGKHMIHLVLDASSRIDNYTDEIIELKQKREEKDQ